MFVIFKYNIYSLLLIDLTDYSLLLYRAGKSALHSQKVLLQPDVPSYMYM